MMRALNIFSLLLGVTLLLGVAWMSSKDWPQSHVVGFVMEDDDRSGPSVSSTIRVGTYNIHSTKGLDGERSLVRIADVLSTPELDFIGLNEVRSDALRTTNHAEELADILDMSWVYAPTQEKMFSGWFGSGFLSRLRILDYRITALPWEERKHAGVLNSKSQRNLVTVHLTLGGQQVAILLTHLDRGPLRLRQLEYILSEFVQYDHVVLMGDLNSRHSEAPLKLLLDGGAGIDATYLNEAHDDHIDWILVRGFEVVKTGMHPKGASDHPQFWSELRVVAGGSPASP